MSGAVDDEGARPPAGRAAVGARTLAELGLLLRDTGALWWSRYPRLLAWFCLGFAVHHLGQQASAQIGAEHQLLATMLFVLGVLGWLGALVMMIHALKPALWTPWHPERGALADLVPQPVFTRERGLDVLTLALAPFLAVYSVWGLVEDEVDDLLFANLSQGGLTDPTTWSVSFAPERLPFYAVLAVAAWLVSKALAVLRARLTALPDGASLTLRTLAIVADGTAVFGLFVGLGIAVDRARSWWEGRAASTWPGEAWRAVLDVLPDWQLWGISLPDALRETATWFWSTLLPALSDRVLLPLMWLALTATVLGWREVRGRDVAAGTRLEAAAGRFDRVGETTARRAGALPAALALATDDLRTKYLPVANALRLIWRAGPRFVGVYLVAATALWAAEVWADEGLVRLIGPQPEDVVFALEPFLDLLLGAVFLTASVALYATAFDRAVAEVTRTPWRRVPGAGGRGDGGRSSGGQGVSRSTASS